MRQGYSRVVTGLASGALALALGMSPALSQETVTLTMWNGFAASENAPLKALIEKYWTPTHPNIKIDVQGEKTAQAILTALSGGGAPDIVISPDSESPALWAENGAIDDLTAQIAPIKAQLESTVVPAALQWLHSGDKWFALPFVDYNWSLYYNKTLFKAAGLDPEHPPATIDELTADARKLTIVDNGEIKQLGYLPSHDQWGAILVGLAFGAKFTDASGQPTLNTPQMIKALEWESNLTKEFGLDKVAAFTSGFTRGDNPFRLGKVAMYVDGSWQSVMNKSVPDLDFGVAPFPGSDPANDNANAVGTNPIVIPAAGGHKAEAFEFAKFLALNGELSSEYAGAVANLPQIKDRLATFSNDPKVTFFAQLSSSPNAVAWAPTLYARRYADELGKAIGEIFDRGVPVADALAAAQAVIADEAKATQ